MDDIVQDQPLPTDLWPETLGIEWGMSQEQCLANIGSAPIFQSSGFLEFMLPIRQQLHEVELFFLDNSLQGIQVDLLTSRSFPDDERDSYEAMVKATQEYKSHYFILVEHYSQVLGTPAFSGIEGMVGFPLNTGAWYVTYWDYPQGRAQVELVHEDEEDPFVIRIATYLPQ